MIDVGNLGFYFDLGIELPDVICGSDGFRRALDGVMFGEHGLTLQIGCFDKVSIDDAQLADTSPR